MDNADRGMAGKFYVNLRQMCKRISFLKIQYWVGSRNFPRSLCFMWFCFGLEILRLVYKKVFYFKYWSVSILFDLLASKKTAPSLIRDEKKISSKLGAKGIKKSGKFCAYFKNVQNSYVKKFPKIFFSEKTFFCKIFQVPKHLVFL